MSACRPPVPAERGPRASLSARAGAWGMLVILVACTVSEQPPTGPAPTVATPRETPSEPGPTTPASPTDLPSESPTAAATPAPTPEPPYSIALPPELDDRRVAVTVIPEPGAEPPRLVIRVTSAADERIGELLLRWSQELHDVVYLAPFVPSPDRVADGGQPLSLFVDWTRWVMGPGSDGEPPGTITLGYGPLDPGATLEIPLYVLRRDVPGPLAFDLQVIASELTSGDPPRREALLRLDDGAPAELRVELP
jgi:hypothetical protein